MSLQEQPKTLTQSYGNVLPPEDRPLTNKEKLFAQEYVTGKSGAECVRRAGYNCKAASVQANQLLKKPNIVKYINQLQSQARTESVATAEEVMEYLTKVMRGEVRDVNNKPVSISERSRAAIELAKRTVDLANPNASDSVIRVHLDWSRGETVEKKPATPSEPV